MLIIHNLEIQTNLSYNQTIIFKQAKTLLGTINHNMDLEVITLENNKWWQEQNKCSQDR